MLQLPLFTFLNGPPGSGKSTLAELLVREGAPNVFRESFAEPIREMIRAVFYPEEFGDLAVRDLRTEAEKVRLLPQTQTPTRTAMISFSEHWMKPEFGGDIFGRLLLARCEAQRNWYTSFVIDDSGFPQEAHYILQNMSKVFGSEAAARLIRLHRAGCDFRGDSRGYIDLSIPTLDLQNDGTPEAMLAHLKAEVL